MNEIIKVTLDDEHDPIVSGRQLHEALGVNSNYTTWFDRMTEYGFVENQRLCFAFQFWKPNRTGRSQQSRPRYQA